MPEPGTYALNESSAFELVAMSLPPDQDAVRRRGDVAGHVAGSESDLRPPPPSHSEQHWQPPCKWQVRGSSPRSGFSILPARHLLFAPLRRMFERAPESVPRSYELA